MWNEFESLYHKCFKRNIRSEQYLSEIKERLIAFLWFNLMLLCVIICCSLSAPESTTDDSSSSKQVDLNDEKNRNSGSDSPRSGSASENQLPDKKESSSPRTLDNYADIGLVQDNSPSYAPSESQQQDHPELPGFSVSSVQIFKYLSLKLTLDLDQIFKLFVVCR